MFIEVAKNRRSIKNFSSQPVEQEKIDAIIEVALRSPSGRAARPWEFIVVTDTSSEAHPRKVNNIKAFS
jgi:nitroreductase